MIAYNCECGVGILISDNTEASRKLKKTFKKMHSKTKPGHGYIRTKAQKIKS